MAAEHLTSERVSVELWTDGACKGNPGSGGWGFILCYQGHQKESFGGEHQTTNNRMELMAVIQGLKALKKPCHVQIHTDSQYVLKGMTEWIDNWKRNGWRTASKQPVKNADLWQELDQLRQTHVLDWHWVKGHAGNVLNERADVLANQGVQDLAVAKTE